MSKSLKKIIEEYGYENGYKKYIIDHPSSAKRIKIKIEEYGLKEGIDTIIRENTKRYSNTKEKFIKLYGEKEGILKWEKFKSPRVSKKERSKRSIVTLEKYVEKYGKEDGTILWNKYKDSLKYTKEKCIEKHGKEEGTKKWNDYIKKMSESCKKSTTSSKMKYINSIDYYINKYGKEEGEKKYFIWKKSQDHSSKKFLIEKYGIENGLKKYKEIGFKRAFHSDSYHSKISQELFETIKNVMNETDKTEFKYSNNGGELRLYDKNESKPYYYDFSYKNKIIEYNGDFWHANPEIYSSDYCYKNGIYASDIWEKDFKKTSFAKTIGYDVLIIWHSEYKKDKIGTLEKCLKFLTNNE